MRTMTRTLTAALLAVLITSSAPAGWNPGDEDRMHYPQLPDLSTNGMDVLAGPWWRLEGFDVAFLADDFQADRTGYLTDIHVWTSYYQNCAALLARVSLAIYADAGGSPGASVWDAYVYPAENSPYASANGPFYDPVADEVIGTASGVRQLSFSIPRAQAFCQQAGETYWLGLQMSTDFNDDGLLDTTDLTRFFTDPGALGWRTSGEAHFGGNAVWTGGYFFGGYPPGPHWVPTGGWNELAYPAGHALAGQNMDLAFVVDGALAGDFDDDGDVDDEDIDLIGDAIRLGWTDPIYDITADGQTEGQDGVIDRLDQQFLIFDLVETSTGTGTEYGDADLDGDVDITDLTILATYYFSGGSKWIEGNFNRHLDLVADTTDLTILATSFGYGVPPFPDAIPEPASAALVLMGGSPLLARRRKARR